MLGGLGIRKTHHFWQMDSIHLAKGFLGTPYKTYISRIWHSYILILRGQPSPLVPIPFWQKVSGWPPLAPHTCEKMWDPSPLILDRLGWGWLWPPLAALPLPPCLRNCLHGWVLFCSWVLRLPHVNFLGVFLSMLSLFASSLSSAMFLFPLWNGSHQQHNSHRHHW